MIERHWKGVTRIEQSDNYIKHLVTDTFPKVSLMKGFVKAAILKRPVDEGVEFLIVTTWESIEAIRQFAGEQVDVANVPTAARAMMVKFDEFARHYEVAGLWPPTVIC
jgi:heme-degrading monooxygenase HmoA